MPRRLVVGVLPVVARAIADYLSGKRDEASLDRLAPGWREIARVHFGYEQEAD